MASFAATELGLLFPSLLAMPRNPRPVSSPLGRSPETLVSFSYSIRGTRLGPCISALHSWTGPLCPLSDLVVVGSSQLLQPPWNSARGMGVVARFNEVVTNLLLEGALETFQRYSVDDDDITVCSFHEAFNNFKFLQTDFKLDYKVVKVPGSFEVPVVAQCLGKSGKFDAILCIGAVVMPIHIYLSYLNVISTYHYHIFVSAYNEDIGDTSHYDAVANSAASGVLNAGLSSGVPCIFGVLTCDDMEQIEMASLFKHHLLK
ncbi:hypothetical protein BHE74_00004379 [Ensete ventricosum]|nr:hypothetical protein BHE74_00004379 [Ensete ventricosum]